MTTLRQQLSDSLTPDLGSSVARFPIPVVAASIIAVYSALRIEEVVTYDDLFTRTLYGCVMTFFVATAFQIWGEAQGAGRLSFLGQILGAAAGVGAGMAYHQPWASVVFLMAAAIAFLIASPGLGRAATPARFWSMNAHFGMALVFGLAGVSAVVLGLWAVLATLRVLFDLPLSSRIIEHAWAFGFSFVLPVYWLALTPRTDAFDPDETMDNVLFQAAAALTNVVFIPIALIYAAILHVYGAKIALEGVLPQGQIGWMVSTFLSLGYGAWLLSYQKRGPLLGLRGLFHRIWPPLTAVPAALLGLAAGERIAAYGITEERYLLALIAGLAGTVVIVWLPWRRLDVRVLPIAVVCLLAAMGIGPFNAERMTEKDQARRLVRILDEAGALREGRFVVGSRPAWNDQTHQQAQSVISVLDRRKSLDLLEPALPAEMLTNQAVLSERIGLKDYKPQPSYLFFNSQTTRLEKGLLLGYFSITDAQGRSPIRGMGEPERFLSLDRNVLVLTAPEGEYRFDVQPLIDAPPTPGSDAAAPTLRSGEATFILQSATLKPCGEARCLSAIGGLILLP